MLLPCADPRCEKGTIGPDLRIPAPPKPMLMLADQGPEPAPIEVTTLVRFKAHQPARWMWIFMDKGI